MNPYLWMRQFVQNQLQSLVFLLMMLAVMLLVGWSLAGGIGGVTVVFTLVLFAWSVGRLPSTQVMRWYRARPLSTHEAPQLYRQLSWLCQRAGMDVVPHLYYMARSEANAFAVGQGLDLAIAVTDGLLRQLNDRQRLAVLAHEVSHLQQRDLQVLRLADLIQRITSVTSLFGLGLVLFSWPLTVLGLIPLHPGGTVWPFMLAPLASLLLHSAISRVREFDADLNAVRLTGEPRVLAEALYRLEMAGSWWQRRWHQLSQPSLWRSHPPLEQRIERLLKLCQPPRVFSGRWPAMRG